MKNIGILIGRFQPFHEGHASLVRAALEHADALIILLGSAQRARSAKNPWTYDERKAMIEAALPGLPLYFAPIPDYFYDEKAWIRDCEAAVAHLFPHAQKILFGHTKDASSYYLHCFPDWNYHEFPNYQGIDATALRTAYFLNQSLDNQALPPDTLAYLEQFKMTETYAQLAHETQFLRDYHHSWRMSPYPPIFVTTDALVIINEHLLLIQRKYAPGQGLYALPGGFLDAGEWIVTGVIRELLEETQITLSVAELKASLVDVRAYDYPGRSQIGRVITHVGLFKLEGNLPAVHASDDALQAFFVPLSELPSLQDRFHDDHYQIIRHRLS